MALTIDLHQAFETGAHHAKGSPRSAIHRMAAKERHWLTQQDRCQQLAFFRRAALTINDHVNVHELILFSAVLPEVVYREQVQK